MAHLVHMTLFAGGSDVFKAARKTSRSEAPKTGMDENAIELVKHTIADDPSISSQEITETYYLSHGTIH